ncbi:MAG: hypothetical protein RLZZ488_2679 [Pseudomonadota bacterium]
MLIFYLASLYVVVPLILSGIFDPAPGLFRTARETSSDAECRLLTGEQMRRRLSEENHEAFPRGEIMNEDLMECTGRVLPMAERRAPVESLLSGLSAQIPELVRTAKLRAPEKTLWRIEAFHDDPLVAEKVATAAKTSLSELRDSVFDQSPVLGVSAVAAFSGMKITEGLPILCREYASHLGQNEKLLALFQINPAETQLHAGLCTHTGDWQWLL